MSIPPEILPVVTITLPIVAAILGAAWLQNKRLDDIVNWLGRIEGRLEKIESKLGEHGERLTKLEERLPGPLVHR